MKHLKIITPIFQALVCIIFTHNLFSQQIIGTFEGLDSLAQNPVIIHFKDSTTQISTKEYTITETNHFKYSLKKSYTNLIICVSSYGYKKQCKYIKSPKTDKTYSLVFDLGELQAINFDDVIITAKKQKFKIKDDTVSFDVDAYRDGSERKIEDVIKKLPGVEVNERSGEIKYKGKSVETVTLDGDDLFGRNYSLGTKNINVDMVEQIEAIDNYSDNPILKGIEQGGKTALNLKLKKGKVDFSGNLDTGIGLFKGNKLALDLNANLLGVMKYYKSFATLAHNNIGINHSPFDYFGFDFNAEELEEEDYFAKKIIPEMQFSNLLEDKRSNINKQFFGNYNAIFKIHKRLSIRTNFYYLKDKILSNQFFQNQYQVNNEYFETSDNTFITKKPQQYRGDLKLKYNTSKTSLLEYNFRIRNEKIETPTKIIQNKTSEKSSFLASEDFYIKQDLLWTKKLATRHALQVSLFHSFNDLPQIFSISPAIFGTSSNENEQNSHFKKTFYEGKATYLGSGRKDKYNLIIGTNWLLNPFESKLSDSVNFFSQNSFNYTKNTIYNTGTYNFNRGNWRISPTYSLSFLNRKLVQNNSNLEKQNLVFEPSLNIKYSINSISSLSAYLSYSQTPFDEQNLFLNKILTNNRLTIQNTPNLALQKSQNFDVFYSINDLYNQFEFGVNLGYQKSTGNLFSDANITENTTQITYFYLPKTNENWNIGANISKYLSFIESNFRISSNYTILSFRNIVNNSELRNNQNRFLRNTFFWKTVMEFPLNFENKFTWRNSFSKNENQNAFTNDAFNNKFKIIFRYKKEWFFSILSDYYLPRKEKNEEYFMFLDAKIRYTPKSKKWDTFLALRNLTNEENFQQIQTSDISTNIFRSNLLPRHFILSISWGF